MAFFTFKRDFKEKVWFFRDYLLLKRNKTLASKNTVWRILNVSFDPAPKEAFVNLSGSRFGALKRTSAVNLNGRNSVSISTLKLAKCFIHERCRGLK